MGAGPQLVCLMDTCQLVCLTGTCASLPAENLSPGVLEA